MSTAFTITMADVATAALKKLGVIVQGDSATGADLTGAIFALNVMAGHFFTLGMPFYRECQHTISTLVAGTNSYEVSPDTTTPLGGVWGVYQAFLRDKNTKIDIPLRVVSREEYNAMTNKTQQGTPVMVTMSPDGRYCYLYLTPDANIATNKQIVLYGYKQEDAVSAGDDELIFPREWGDALIYGLAVRLAPEYGTPLDFLSNLQVQAESHLRDAINWNPEPASIYFGASVYGRA